MDGDGSLYEVRKKGSLKPGTLDIQNKTLVYKGSRGKEITIPTGKITAVEKERGGLNRYIIYAASSIFGGGIAIGSVYALREALSGTIKDLESEGVLLFSGSLSNVVMLLDVLFFLSIILTILGAVFYGARAYMRMGYRVKIRIEGDKELFYTKKKEDATSIVSRISEQISA